MVTSARRPSVELAAECDGIKVRPLRKVFIQKGKECLLIVWRELERRHGVAATATADKAERSGSGDGISATSGLDLSAAPGRSGRGGRGCV